MLRIYPTTLLPKEINKIAGPPTKLSITKAVPNPNKTWTSPGRCWTKMAKNSAKEKKAAKKRATEKSSRFLAAVNNEI